MSELNWLYFFTGIAIVCKERKLFANTNTLQEPNNNGIRIYGSMDNNNMLNRSVLGKRRGVIMNQTLNNSKNNGENNLKLELNEIPINNMNIPKCKKNTMKNDLNNNINNNNNNNSNNSNNSNINNNNINNNMNNINNSNKKGKTKKLNYFNIKKKYT